MKAVLEFNLDDSDDKAKHLRAMKADDAFLALWQISQSVFRPARKHGYSDSPELNAFLNAEDSKHSEIAHEVTHLLERRFLEVLTEYHVHPDDYLE